MTPAAGKVDLTTRRVRAFVTVAESTTLAEAAAALQVGEAEARKGVTEFATAVYGPKPPHLFDVVRDHRMPGRGVIQLTEAGQRLLPIARRLLKDAADLLSQARPSDRLPLLACYPAHVRRVVAQAYASPDCEFEILEVDDSFRASHGQKLFEDLRRGSVDALIGPASEPAEQGLVSRRLYPWHLVAVFKKGSIKSWAGKNRLQIEDLRSARLLVSPETHTSRDVLENAFASIGRKVNVAYESRSTETLLALADQGVGVAVMPDDAVWGLPKVRSVIAIDETKTVRWHAIYWRRDEEKRNQKLDAFIKTVAAVAAPLDA